MLPAKDISRWQGTWQDTGEPIVMIKMSGGDAGLQEDCHFVALAPAPCGYVMKYLGNYKTGYIHRLIYEEKYGELPKGRHLHHLCHNKLCVNPDHLVSLTAKEHFRLHSIPKAAEYYQSQKECAKGHELSDYSGRKICKVCRYERNKRWKLNPGVRERNIEVKQAWRAKVRAEGRVPA
jgi:hypothetical protein